MNFEDALKAMRDGKQVRRPCRCYILMDICKDNDTIIDATGDLVNFDSDEILADDWEIVP